MTKILGIIGCGNIGASLARYVNDNLTEQVAKIILFDTDVEKAEALCGELTSAEIAENSDNIFDDAHLVVEAVGPSVVPGLLGKAIECEADLMIMSVGGLLEHVQKLDDARRLNIRIILPSGAIAGIDALKAAKISGIESVSIVTRKPPKSIKGAPYLEEKGIDVDTITDETIIFDGPVREAVKAFPKNINVSALLAIAGAGPDQTNVRIAVSPEFTKNSHEITVQSKAGRITARTDNVPSPQNPKTSYLAILSAISSLQDYFDPIRIGG